MIFSIPNSNSVNKLFFLLNLFIYGMLKTTQYIFICVILNFNYCGYIIVKYITIVFLKNKIKHLSKYLSIMYLSIFTKFSDHTF